MNLCRLLSVETVQVLRCMVLSENMLVLARVKSSNKEVIKKLSWKENRSQITNSSLSLDKCFAFDFVVEEEIGTILSKDMALCNRKNSSDYCM